MLPLPIKERFTQRFGAKDVLTVGDDVKKIKSYVGTILKESLCRNKLKTTSSSCQNYVN